jgi:hypothetical protein
MKRIACVTVVGVSLLAAPLSAAAADGSGLVGVSCGTWTQGRKSTDDALQFSRESFVLGFMSAIARLFLPVGSSLSEGTDVEGLFSYIDNYCAAHPLDNLAAASEVLSRELVAKWHAAHPARQ